MDHSDGSIRRVVDTFEPGDQLPVEFDRCCTVEKCPDTGVMEFMYNDSENYPELDSEEANLHIQVVEEEYIPARRKAVYKSPHVTFDPPKLDSFHQPFDASKIKDTEKPVGKLKKDATKIGGNDEEKKSVEKEKIKTNNDVKSKVRQWEAACATDIIEKAKKFRKDLKSRRFGWTGWRLVNKEENGDENEVVSYGVDEQLPSSHKMRLQIDEHTGKPTWKYYDHESAICRKYDNLTIQISEPNPDKIAQRKRGKGLVIPRDQIYVQETSDEGLAREEAKRQKMLQVYEEIRTCYIVFDPQGTCDPLFPIENDGWYSADNPIFPGKRKVMQMKRYVPKGDHEEGEKRRNSAKRRGSTRMNEDADSNFTTKLCQYNHEDTFVLWINKSVYGKKSGWYISSYHQDYFKPREGECGYETFHECIWGTHASPRSQYSFFCPDQVDIRGANTWWRIQTDLYTGNFEIVDKMVISIFQDKGFFEMALENKLGKVERVLSSPAGDALKAAQNKENEEFARILGQLVTINPKFNLGDHPCPRVFCYIY